MPTANNKNHIATLKIITIDCPLFREAITSWALTSIGGTSRMGETSTRLGYTRKAKYQTKKRLGGMNSYILEDSHTKEDIIALNILVCPL